MQPIIFDILLATALLSAVLVLTVQVPRLIAVIKKSRIDNAASKEIDYVSLPGISVIVYTHNSVSGLERLIPQLMRQDYPHDRYEVVVVNDGANPATESLLLLFEAQWPDLLRHTFTPADTRGISSKNLALMLGIKSAHFPVVLHTTSDVSIESDKWAACMAAPFANDRNTQIVIGSAVLNNGKNIRRRIHLMETAGYLASAIRHRPWRGDGANLAYTRQLFFDNKGFSSILNLRHGGGDDDAYISMVANSENTAVSIAHDAIVALMPDNHVIYWRNATRRRRWAWKQCKSRARRLQAFTSILLWVSLLSTLAAGAIGIPDPFKIIAPICVQLVLWTALALLWRKVSVALGDRPCSFSVPWILLLRPLRTIYHFRFV